MKRKGFTLIEIMIVVLIIATIAIIAIPSILRSRIAANETSAIGVLRNIVISQHQFKSAAIIDQDQEGDGEFATLAELSGRAIGRGNTVLLDPNFISVQVTPRESSPFAQRAGYLIQIFLPSSNAAGLTDNGTNQLPTEADIAVITLQEQKFRIYAWPQEFSVTGNRAFASDESAEIYSSTNLDSSGNTVLSGTASPPTFDSAVSVNSGGTGSASDFSGRIKSKDESVSGLVWIGQ